MSKINQNKINQLKERQRKNIFFTRLKIFCNLISSSQVYTMMPEEDMDLIYLLRGQVIKIQSAEGQQVPKKILAESKYLVSLMIKQEPLSLKENLIVSLDYFYTIVFLYIIIILY